MQVIDEIFNYATAHQLLNQVADVIGKLQGQARCRVRINGNVVVATELPDNPGQSITNAAPVLAMQVCKYYEIAPDQLIWIEHYSHQSNHEETFDLIEFTFDGTVLSPPEWRHLSKHDVEQLFGATIS